MFQWKKIPASKYLREYFVIGNSYCLYKFHRYGLVRFQSTIAAYRPDGDISTCITYNIVRSYRIEQTSYSAYYRNDFGGTAQVFMQTTHG